jgi:glycine/D-amino acid oxidase-like deaminating enzyme
VVVVGPGPAGLEAARVLALRGHTVTVLERASEAWSCAGLTRVIKHLGGKVSHDKGDVAPRLEALLPLRERLSLLNRGQASVVRRLDRLLEGDCDRETGSFLRQMRSLHAENVHRYEDLIMTLATSDTGAV